MESPVRLFPGQNIFLVKQGVAVPNASLKNLSLIGANRYHAISSSCLCVIGKFTLSIPSCDCVHSIAHLNNSAQEIDAIKVLRDSEGLIVDASTSM
jgi:hypothetical protein